MNFRRIIVGSMTLTFAVLLTGSATFAQNPGARPPEDRWSHFAGDPFDQVYAAADQPRTEMEWDEQQMATTADVPFSPQAAPAAGLSPAGGNTVSVHQLRHPLSRKGRRLLSKAESFFKHGQADKAKQQLAEAVKEPSAEPYAHAMLGTEYLRGGQLRDAITELESAARVLPISSVHSNLGFALCLNGDTKHGQAELQEALRLDGNSPKARFLLGIVLLNEKSTEAEALYELNLAQSQVRAAHLALAVCEIRRGDSSAAEEELRKFLGAGYRTDLPRALKWASVAAAQPHPAVAFGFPY